eukprot:m.1585294 g.1585294  ORF g.1585294 m.1585294 type:complete len:489 (+) comp25323_c0_seq3:2962-4428(+)
MKCSPSVSWKQWPWTKLRWKRGMKKFAIVLLPQHKCIAQPGYGDWPKKKEKVVEANTLEALRATQEKLKALTDAIGSVGATDLHSGVCWGCDTGATAVIRRCLCTSKGSKGLCAHCFSVHFEASLNDTHMLRSNRIECFADPDTVQDRTTSDECHGNMTLDEGLRCVRELCKDPHHVADTQLHERCSELEQTLREKCQHEAHRLTMEKQELEAKNKELSLMKEVIAMPGYWKREKDIMDQFSAFFRGQQTTQPNKPYIKVKEGNAFVDEIQRLIDHTCIQSYLGRGRDQRRGEKYSKLRVVSVHRVENVLLWHRYKATMFSLQACRAAHSVAEPPLSVTPVTSERDCLGKELYGRTESLRPQVNENLLFHGTSEVVCDAIFSHGFNERHANDGLYGLGNYFAQNSNKADQYALNFAGKHHMILARVCLGAHPFLTSETQVGMRIPPPIHNNGRQPRTSVIGTHGQHKEFVIYDGMQAYPEYHIVYERE